MKRILLPFLLLIIAFGAITACGQKGDLYDPNDPEAAQKHKKDRYGL